MRCLSLVAALLAGRADGFSTRTNRRAARFRAATTTATNAETERAATTITNKTAAIDSSSIDTTSIFNVVASKAALCLVESDLRRDAKTNAITAPSSATNWIHDASAFALQKTLDKMEFISLQSDNQLHQIHFSNKIDRDELASWMRWMKAAPVPAIVDLSANLRAIVNETVPNEALLDQTRSQFLHRFFCRLVLLPSGSKLPRPFSEPPASLIYGKLLLGGVTRYRLIGSTGGNSRKAGERTEIKSPLRNTNPSCWIMYGGPKRMYQAADMGPCAIFELGLLPQGTHVHVDEANPIDTVLGPMRIQNLGWKPRNLFAMANDDKVDSSQAVADADDDERGFSPSSFAGKTRNEAFRVEFESKVGGLQPQIDAIVRRVLDGRVIRPADGAGDQTSRALAVAALEAEELSLLGLTPVRGLLLYGPPGCGKTALVRELSRALRARAPKIIAAPELLDRWVGGSEKAVRALFADAEAELASCNGDAAKSALHVVVIDEIDAVFRKRNSAEDSGEATRSSVVNQILSKLDGVNAIPNVLFIGMTNRRELLDHALLRPGRLEVQIEIPHPDKEGRREILNIHFGALRKKGRLSIPLCCAIDGVAQQSNIFKSNDTAADKLRPGRKLFAIRQQITTWLPIMNSSIYDLAADYATGGFSGADIAGLVRCAGSIALSRARKDGTGVDGLLITLEDVKQGIKEVKR
jgi:vesicle-fusing ATPase